MLYLCYCLAVQLCCWRQLGADRRGRKQTYALAVRCVRNAISSKLLERIKSYNAAIAMVV
jgi:hypothetical protein